MLRIPVVVKAHRGPLRTLGGLGQNTESHFGPAMLTTRIANFLNAGDGVVAQPPATDVGSTCFVRIRPVAKPGIPREDRRYLNSTWSMWEYWDFEFRRFVLRDGWQRDEWNYDRYIVQDERITTHDSNGFEEALRAWVPDVNDLQHVTDSPCPE